MTIVTLTCVICKNDFNVARHRQYSAKTCSTACRSKLSSITLRKQVEVTCLICGKKFGTKPSNASRRKTCSKECFRVHQSIQYTGEGNPRAGIYGAEHHTTEQYVGGETKLNSNGYIVEFVPGRRWVRQHRLLAEKYLATDENSIVIKSGERRLKKNYVVHHIDENKTNNDLDNLCIMTKSEHSSYHNRKSPMPHSKINGKFTSVVHKSRELLENPEEDNQQPSV